MRSKQLGGVSGSPSPSVGADGGGSMDPGDSERSGYRRAARWALAGALLRAAAYFLPWVIAEEGTFAYLRNGQPVNYMNGSAVGAPVLSIGFSLVAAGVAVTALVWRDKVDGLALKRLGLAAIAASVINLFQLFQAVGHVRDQFMNTGLVLTPSVGPWAQLAGAFGIYAGGVMAVRVQQRFGSPKREAEASTPSPLPPPPAPTAPSTFPPVSQTGSRPSGLRGVAIVIGVLIIAAAVLIPLT